MHRTYSVLFAALALSCTFVAIAQHAAVKREETGNRVSENVPAVPAELAAKLNRYLNTRSASFAGWAQDGCVLIGTRFAETTGATCAAPNTATNAIPT